MAIEGIQVTAFRKTEDGSFVNSGTDTSDVNGEWTIVGLDDAMYYAYKFYDPTGTYLTAYYKADVFHNSTLLLDDATVFIPGTLTPTIILKLSATQSGTVT